VSQTVDPVAGRLAYPASLLTFQPLPARGLQGFSVTSVILGRSLGLTTFMAFTSPSERSKKRWNRLSVVPPLMGFVCSLPPVHLLRVHSREPRLPSGQRCHTPAHVPLSWFRTTSTVSSAQELRVCCTPQPAKGSSRFMLSISPRRPKTTRRDGDNSRDAVHTLRRLSLASSRTASLRPLPSCRFCPARPGCQPKLVSLPTAARRSEKRTPIIPYPGLPSRLPRGASVQLPC
jgi:hypothetical protein